MDCYEDEQHFSYLFDVAVYLFFFVLFSFVFSLLHSSFPCVPSKDILERRAAMIEMEQNCPVFTLCFCASGFFVLFFQFSSSDLLWLQTNPLLHS